MARRSRPRIIAEDFQVTDYSNFRPLLSEGRTGYLSLEVSYCSAGLLSCKLVSFDLSKGFGLESSSLCAG